MESRKGEAKAKREQMDRMVDFNETVESVPVKAIQTKTEGGESDCCNILSGEEDKDQKWRGGGRKAIVAGGQGRETNDRKPKGRIFKEEEVEREKEAGRGVPRLKRGGKQAGLIFAKSGWRARGCCAGMLVKGEEANVNT